MINILGVRYETAPPAPDTTVEVRQIIVPLRELGLALTAIETWGRGGAAHAALGGLMRERPELFPVTMQTIDRPEDASRQDIAAWDLTQLRVREQDVVGAGYHTVNVEGKQVQGMARRIEQGLGCAALEQGLSVEDALQAINFAVNSPAEYAELARAVDGGEALFRNSAPLYPPAAYIMDSSGVWVPA
jgi:hypothetical protein